MKNGLAPEDFARELVSSSDAEWLRDLLSAVEAEIRVEPLRRLANRWDLSNAAAARLFGVTRQAFSKWLASGPPADRADDIARVDAMVELLDRYVKRERVPAVVRRQAPMFGDASIIEMLEEGRYQEAHRRVTEVFDLRRVQP